MSTLYLLAVAFVLAVYAPLVAYLVTKEYKPVSKYVKDLAERIVATFIGAFVAAVPVGSIFEWHISTVKGAAMAGAAAVFSLVKGLIAKRFGDPTSASLVADKEV